MGFAMQRNEIPRRTVLAGALTGALTGTLRGSANGLLIGRSPAQEKSQRATLRILIPKGSEANLAPITAAFEKTRDVKIVVETCGVDDVSTEMTLRTMAGQVNFDVALPPSFAMPDLVEAGIIQPLEESAAHGETSEDRGSLYSFGDRYKGTLYGHQTDGDVYLMFYNQRLFEDEAARKRFVDLHGRELTIPQTWEELDQAMEFFHHPAAGQFGGNLFRSAGYIGWEFWVRLHAKGVFPVDDEMRPRLGTPEGIEAAQQLIDASRWLRPGSRTAGLFDNWKDFEEGQTFCNIGWGGSQKHFRRPTSKVRDGLIFASTPGGRIDGSLLPLSYFNWGWNFAVSNRTPHPELSAEFTRFATTGDAAVAAVRAVDGFFDPYLEAHYEDEAIEAIYTRPFLDQHRRSLEQAIPDFYLAGRGEYFDLLGRFLVAADRGEMPVAEALKVISAGWDVITNRIGRSSQISQWQFIKSRYPESIRSRLA